MIRRITPKLKAEFDISGFLASEITKAMTAGATMLIDAINPVRCVGGSAASWVEAWWLWAMSKLLRRGCTWYTWDIIGI